jgi:hypothetical protein
MRSIGARILIFLVAIVALCGASGPVRAQYFCRMMGRVGPECCCGTAPDREAVSREARLRATDCCERIEPAALQAVAAAPDSVVSVPAAPAVAILPSFVVALPPVERSVALRRLARAPPPLAKPPLFIAQCALLI